MVAHGNVLPSPFANLRTAFTAFWHDLTRDALRPYRPELHYMRGPGPASRAKRSDF
jgi:hypothetical protein